MRLRRSALCPSADRMTYQSKESSDWQVSFSLVTGARHKSLSIGTALRLGKAQLSGRLTKERLDCGVKTEKRYMNELLQCWKHTRPIFLRSLIEFHGTSAGENRLHRGHPSTYSIPVACPCHQALRELPFPISFQR